MHSWLRAAWLDVRASYWFIPSLLTLGAIGLALTSIHLDRQWGSEWLAAYNWFEIARPEGARAQLTVIASAMIAVASTVFAITIAAVAYASGNYGPRLLTNFMNDRGNQYSLGVFIATFTYNLLVLRVIRTPEEVSLFESQKDALSGFVPQLSMLVSSASALIAVAVLVYFLHHIPASIRIDTVLGGIGEKLLDDIAHRFPTRHSPTEPASRVPGVPVPAQDVGYIEIIDFAQLDDVARECGITIALQVRTGDFVHPHVPVAETTPAADDKVQRRILDCFLLGRSRTPTQDLEFLIDELVEIALRALSPGINDPFTAITSIHWMGAALARLADRDLAVGPEQDDYDRARVQPLPDTFAHLVERSFGAVRASAAANPLAGLNALAALSRVAAGALWPQRVERLKQEAAMLANQAALALDGPSLAEFRRRYDSLFGPA